MPALPDELVSQALFIATSANTNTKEARGVYRRYPVTDELLAWCQQYILPSLKNDFKIGIQVFFGPPKFPHTDGNRGTKALNFLIDAGGDQVDTVWLQEEGFPLIRSRGYVVTNNNTLHEIERTTFKPRTWQVVQTDIIHTVENITRPRISLSIGLEEDEYRSFLLRNIV